jgi:hypothetical protein
MNGTSTQGAPTDVCHRGKIGHFRVRHPEGLHDIKIPRSLQVIGVCR